MLISSLGLLFHQTDSVLAPGSVVSTSTPAQALLRSVQMTRADGASKYLPLADSAPLSIAKGDFSLRFEFAVPDYAREGTKKYQAQLQGYDSRMSNWSSARAYTYSNLKPGKYTLHLRAKDAADRETAITPFTFVVTPPWYETLWARLLYALALIVFIGWLLRLYTWRRTQLLARRNLELENKVDIRTQELAELNRRLDMMAHVDGLTGVPNRRRLDEYLPVVASIAHQQGKSVSIIIIDVDHFKQYNDRHGHLAGDKLLQGIAQQLLSCLRRSEDLLARYGGEEFMIVLPSADQQVALETAERMRVQVASSSMGVTVSAGIATSTINDAAAGMSALIKRADDALYQAKNSGRNRVVVAR